MGGIERRIQRLEEFFTLAELGRSQEATRSERSGAGIS